FGEGFNAQEPLEAAKIGKQLFNGGGAVHIGKCLIILAPYTIARACQACLRVRVYSGRERVFLLQAGSRIAKTAARVRGGGCGRSQWLTSRTGAAGRRAPRRPPRPNRARGRCPSARACAERR